MMGEWKMSKKKGICSCGELKGRHYLDLDLNKRTWCMDCECVEYEKVREQDTSSQKNEKEVKEQC